MRFPKFYLLLVFLFTSPLQGLGYVTLAPIFLLAYLFSEVKKIHVFKLILFFIFCLLVYLISSNLDSFIRIFAFFTILFFSYLFDGSIKFKVKRNLIVLPLSILFVTIFEKILLVSGWQNPWPHDDGSVLFVFQEKSYAAMFVSFCMAITAFYRSSFAHFLIYFVIFIIINSGLGFLFFFIYLFILLLPNVFLNFFYKLYFPTIIILYFALILFIQDLNINILILSNLADFARILFNAMAIESSIFQIVPSGSIFIHEVAGFDNYIGNEFLSGYADRDPEFWKGQSIGPNVIMYFGVYGAFFILALNFIINLNLTKIFNIRIALPIIFFIAVQFWIQGTLLNPYLLIILLLSRGKIKLIKT